MFRFLASSVLSLVMLAALLIPSASRAQEFAEGPELDQSKDYYAEMVTSLGTLKIKLMPEAAPITVRNFVNLAEGTREFRDPKTGEKAKRPYYNGVIFHRCIPNFMVQGGDPTGTGMGGPGYQFEDEFKDGLVFDRPGLLAMANAGPRTNGSQFFITEVPTTHLNKKHTIFGELVDSEAGMELVRKMARQPQNRANNKPNEDISIERLIIHRVAKGAAVDTVPFGSGKVEPKAEATEAAPAAEAMEKPAE